MSDAARGHFDAEAEQYDDLIPRLIPGYFEQHAALLETIPFARERPLRAADLGCGTGVLGEVLLDAYPEATLAAVDIAPNMVRACRARLERFGERVTCGVGDIAHDSFGGRYDAIVSGLAIHHLDDVEKRALYVRIHDALVPGGVFATRDVVLGETAEETEAWNEQWRAFLREQGEDDAYWFERHLAEDKPAALRDHMAWLEEAGFTDASVSWRRMGFAVWTAARPVA
jgi:tRNA (cmo5U34)-methyltransferase